MKAVADSLPRRKGALSIRMLGWIAVASMLAVALLGPSAGGVAAAEGAIWTTAITCASPAPQDQNLYVTGETVHIRGENFTPGQTYNWTITGNPGGSSTDPGIEVASGTVIADTNGNFCVTAYTIPVGDDGEYTVDVPPAKNDNYRVNGTEPTPTPTPTATVPAPTPTPTPTATVPAPTPTPTGGVVEATGTPGITPPSTSTDMGSSGIGSDGWRIPLLGIGLLFGVLLLLTPSRTVRRRR
jgi:hypothetical protein